ncbi:MAG: PilN domain-containing protein [Acidobacteriota bacterium]|nr:PilN domain-containing protein [Acidobacteriota bacterium]
MITKLNLATQPFRNRTLPYLAALLLLTFAVAGAIFAFAELRRTVADNELAKSDIEQMSVEVKNLKGQGERVQQELTPDQSTLLIAAHQLVANKTFGWSRLFADLEQVLPGSVSVSRINVQNIFKEGDRTKAELEFGVLSRDYQSVMTMIDNMNGSGLFQAELRGQDRQKTERLTYSEYTLRLVYTSRNNYAPASDVAQTQEAQEANR